MPDEITPEERALIDKALKAKAVTQVAPNVSGFNSDIIWDADLGRLVYADKDFAQGQFRGHKPGKKKCPKVAARRMKVKDMLQSGMTAREVSEALGISEPMVRRDAQEVGHVFNASDTQKKIAQQKREAIEDSEAPRIPAPQPEPSPPAVEPVDLRKGPRPHVAARREKVLEMQAQGMSASDIAKALGVSKQMVNLDGRALNIKFRRAVRTNAGDAAADRRTRSAEKKRAQVRDRRRHKTTSVPTGDVRVSAPDDSTGTLHPQTVATPSKDEAVLKDGALNSKIGGDVLVGWLKGARIFTLALEERATCPDTCALWTKCYGNSLHLTRRWTHGPALIDRLESEIAQHCAEHDNVLIRLHVLGDFWSAEYLRFWADMLDRHENLHVFGFTAWPVMSKIGLGVAWLREQAPRRFMVRTSGMTGAWGSFTIDFPTDKKRIGDAIVCPEQLDATNDGSRSKHCGNCGACWSSSVPICFMEHG